MSDTPTKDPKTGRTVIQMKAKHEQPSYGGRIKETSPGVFKLQIPPKGKECGYEKAHNRQEARFNRRGAVRVWNKVRPHIPASRESHRSAKVPDYPYPTKVKPPECKKSYDGKPIQ